MLAVRFVGHPDFDHQRVERIGVLLINSGTPDSLSMRDVRRFLGRLLSDPRVVEMQRALWLPILHGIILRTRPFRSARKYRSIWKDQGSPLLRHGEALRDGVRAELARLLIAPTAVELGMLYSSPGVDEALLQLRKAGASRILVLPLFPQYAGATGGASFDQVSAVLQRWRWVPDLRFVSEYPDHPGYIEALRESVASHWERHGRTRHLLMSFHGIPERYFRDGDPYFCKVQKTARLLADELRLAPEEWSVAFQSKYGPGRWLQPYTEDRLDALAAQGIGSITVVCPGFASDCLETLEEVDIEYRKRFLAAGGRVFQYVPALNSSGAHVRAIVDIISRHLGGWTSFSPEWLREESSVRG